MPPDQTTPDRAAEIDWRADGLPIARRFGDPYYSAAGGLAETRAVFLAGNGLPGRFVPGFQIAELGFGTGLTMLAALLAWRAAGVAGVLRFTSFEAFPMSTADTARALAAFPDVTEAARPFLAALEDGKRRFSEPGLDAEVIVGDARETVPAWTGRADAWCLDGFAPAVNPEMWEAGLLRAVAARTRPGGTCASYTAAGHVRRALADAGFAVSRVPGFGTKRHMTRGTLA